LAKDPNEQWQLDIGPEVAGQLAYVYVTQAWVSSPDAAEAFLGLYGMSSYFPKDFDNGVFTANFHNDWGALDELAVYMAPFGGDDTHDLYTAPVLVNGERFSLVVMQDRASGEFSMLGAMPPIDDDTGMAGKELYQLQAGDLIEAIMYILLPEGYTDEFTGSRLFDMPLGNLTYQEGMDFHLRPVSGIGGYQTGWAYFMVMFVMTDFAGNTYYSAPGYYRALGGVIEAVDELGG
jgi:hypothetical protein